MKEDILQMLKSRKDFVSGQELCEYFQVSRTAVWKVIGQLKSEGYEIEAINRKGYRLIASPDILTEAEILSGMTTEVMGRHVYYYDCLGSTNDQARMLAEQGAPDGSLVVAETQNTGKGRMGRAFFSPEGCIKWPNDLVIDHRKTTGILTEMSAGPDVVNYIVIGIGINVNMKEFPEELRETAISMAMASGQTYHRAEIIRRVMQYFETNYRQFLKDGNLAFLKKKYDASLIHLNKEISIHEIRRVWRGVSRGINDIGELIVSVDGEETTVRSGEVSIRGVYGKCGTVRSQRL